MHTISACLREMDLVGDASSTTWHIFELRPRMVGVSLRRASHRNKRRWYVVCQRGGQEFASWRSTWSDLGIHSQQMQVATSHPTLAVVRPGKACIVRYFIRHSRICRTYNRLVRLVDTHQLQERSFAPSSFEHETRSPKHSICCGYSGAVGLPRQDNDLGKIAVFGRLHQLQLGT